MVEEILKIVHFMLDAFIHIWPYLLITIPLAVAVQMSGASKYINRAFDTRPVVAILLATLVGAFSPFCSCSVIPVVASLLISGVPLAPVMAFWIASPSMDPEIFFLSVATLGWELAIWRIAATLILSLSAGFITHLSVQRGWLGQEILRPHPQSTTTSVWMPLKQGWQNLTHILAAPPTLGIISGQAAALTSEPACCSSTDEIVPLSTGPSISSCDQGGCGSTLSDQGSSCSLKSVSFRQRLLDETWSATVMVAKFMALAFFLEALIILYIPSEWIAGLVGQQNEWAIVMAVLIGVPVYTSNLTALPMISGLLAQGMNPAAALAFLIAGPTTTIPAMAAVWGLTTRRVFILYVSFALIGAMTLGYLYNLIG